MAWQRTIAESEADYHGVDIIATNAGGLGITNSAELLAKPEWSDRYENCSKGRHCRVVRRRTTMTDDKARLVGGCGPPGRSICG